MEICSKWGSPLFESPYTGEVMFTSLWTLCRADIMRMCETDENLKNTICVDGRMSANICAALPEGSCTAGSSTYNECAMDIYSCMATNRYWDFCHDFPTLCTDRQGFASTDNLVDAVCYQSGATTQFCKTVNNVVELDFGRICENFHLLSDELKWGSSLGTVCALNHEKVCQSEPLKSLVCPTGDAPMESLCQLYTGATAEFPNKCGDATTTTFDHCAANWKACLAERHWNFCASFPQLCATVEDLYRDHHEDHHDQHHQTSSLAPISSSADML